MSGDSKFGMQVGGVSRTAPVHRIGSGSTVPARTVAKHAATADAMPNASLIRLAGELASQPAPIDTARIASLRSAIADGRYAAEPAIIARAMLGHGREGEG